MMKLYSWPVRVYYEDTDVGGVVYYANYLKFFERARTEWLRSFGLNQDKLAQEEGLILRAMADSLALCPPLVTTEAEIDEIFDGVTRALERTQRELK